MSSHINNMGEGTEGGREAARRGGWGREGGGRENWIAKTENETKKKDGRVCIARRSVVEEGSGREIRYEGE